MRLKPYLPGLAVIAMLALLFAPAAFKRAQNGYDVSRLVSPAQAADLFASGNRLVVEKGSARLTRADGSAETVTVEATVGVGDGIAVSPDGFAVLHWFDDSVSRLSGGAEIRVTAADFNPDDISETHVSFEALKGSVWSKAMNLVDGNSTFEAHAGDIVAGVRGSAFNVKVTDDAVLVQPVEHALALSATSGERVLVAGDSAWLPADATHDTDKDVRLGVIAQAQWESDWFRSNGELDKKVVPELVDEMADRLRERVGALPGEPDWDAKQSALAAALKDASGERESLRIETAIASMRTAEFVMRLRKEGTDGKDLGELSDGLEAVIARIRGSAADDGEKRRLLDGVAAEVKLIDRAVADVLPNDETMYDAKERLRAKAREMAGSDEERAKLADLHQRRDLFELDDSLKQGWTLACVQDAKIEAFHARALTDLGFRRMFELFLADIRARCPDAPAGRIRFKAVSQPVIIRAAPTAGSATGY